MGDMSCARAILVVVWLASACAKPPPTPVAATPPAPGPTPSAPSAAPAASGESLPPKLLGPRVPLLGGRLSVSLPASARVDPRGHDIMAADASDEDETRVVVEPGDSGLAHFVLFAQELYVRSSGDLVRDARTLLANEAEGLEFRAIRLASGLSAVTLVPKAPISLHDAAFVSAAIVEHADHTLCKVSFFVVAESAQDAERHAALAASALSSVEPGQAGHAPERTQRIDLGDGSVLVLELKQGSVKTLDRGPDFMVYHVRSIAVVGESPPELGIYLGGYPQPQWQQAGIDKKNVKTTRGRLLGQAVDWYSWQPSPGIDLDEAIVQLSSRGSVHVFVSASPATARELRRAAEAMRLEKK
jgi:hypothetical protein